MDAQGRLVLPVPQRCPAGEDGSRCDVRVHARRERKSGPEHALAVCRCHAHRASFTVYPPGHVPYGRVAMAAADSEGRAVRGSALATTVFGAVLDGSAHDAGPAADEMRGPRVHRRTRARRIRLCAAIVGIAGELTDAVRGRIADALSVSALRLRDAARAYITSRGMRSRASAVVSVLELSALATGRTALLAAGHFAGLWGRPSHWDSVAKALRPLV